MKYFFFDIDGTLTNQNSNGVILDSTFKTLEKLKANGHFVAIATGRAHWNARKFSRLVKIDNLVCNGGNGLVVDDRLLENEPLDHTMCLEIIDECIKKNFAFGLALNDIYELYSCNNLINNYQMHNKIIVDENLDFHQIKNIYKIFIMILKEEEKQLCSLNKIGHVRYQDSYLIIEPMDKYRGILKMIDILGGNKEDIVVFGDGINDLSMIKQAPISIAMGNAVDEVKKAATFITKSSQEAGIEYACKYFGWIE